MLVPGGRGRGRQFAAGGCAGWQGACRSGPGAVGRNSFADQHQGAELVSCRGKLPSVVADHYRVDHRLIAGSVPSSRHPPVRRTAGQPPSRRQPSRQRRQPRHRDGSPRHSTGGRPSSESTLVKTQMGGLSAICGQPRNLSTDCLDPLTHGPDTDDPPRLVRSRPTGQGEVIDLSGLITPLSTGAPPAGGRPSR